MAIAPRGTPGRRDGAVQARDQALSRLNAAKERAEANFVLTRDGALERYSYPEFKFQAAYRLGIVPTQIVCAGKDGKLYIVGIDPRTVAERPRARGYGDLYVYTLKDLADALSVSKRP